MARGEGPAPARGGAAPLPGPAARARLPYNEKPGSLVTGSIEEIPVEDAITGVAQPSRPRSRSGVGVPDTPGMAARIFRTVADAEINIDMVVNSAAGTCTFSTLPAHRRSARRGRAPAPGRPRWGDLLADGNVGKVSGPGCATTRASARSEAL